MRKQAPTETHETGDTSVQEGDGRLWLQTLGHVKFGELVRQLVARVHVPLGSTKSTPGFFANSSIIWLAAVWW